MFLKTSDNITVRHPQTSSDLLTHYKLYPTSISHIYDIAYNSTNAAISFISDITPLSLLSLLSHQ